VGRLLKNFGPWFHRAAGGVSVLAGAATRAGRQWFHGVCQWPLTEEPQTLAANELAGSSIHSLRRL